MYSKNNIYVIKYMLGIEHMAERLRYIFTLQNNMLYRTHENLVCMCATEQT